MPDAVEVPPWRPDMGRPPQVRVYPPRDAPRLQVRVDGAWRDAVVMARHDWPDGRVGVQVTVRLPTPDLGGRLEAYWRTYLWDSGAMRVAGEREEGAHGRERVDAPRGDGMMAVREVGQVEPNTEYGTWGEHGGGDYVTVEETVGSAMDGATEEEVAEAAAEYRARINDALPEGVVLAGQNFYGPYPRDPEVDIAAIVRGVDEESSLGPAAV